MSKGKSNIDCVAEAIEKKYGIGSFMRANSNVVVDIDTISTGSITLDYKLGIGGYPVGRIVEIYGGEASGKTTLALHAIAEVHKRGGEAAFIDVEHALDMTYAKRIGVDIDHLFISQPDYGEQALDILDMIVKSGDLDLIVVDSVAALVPKSELDGDMGDANVATQARLMSQAMRKIVGAISKHRTIVIFINQLREKVGLVFGNPLVTTGGNALKFYSSVRLDVSKSVAIKSGEEVIGAKTKVKVAKNKLSTPYKVAEFDLRYGHGIDRMGEIVDYGVEFNILQKSGSWYSFQDSKIGQGREAVIQFMNDNPDMVEIIEEEIMKHLYNKTN